MAYCSRLQLAGYSDWRLPTNEELLGIYDLSVVVRKTFDDGVTHDVHVKGNLEITGKQWSSSLGANLGQPYETEWVFTLAEAAPYPSEITFPFKNFKHFAYDMRALCVRAAGDE